MRMYMLFDLSYAYAHKEEEDTCHICTCTQYMSFDLSYAYAHKQIQVRVCACTYMTMCPPPPPPLCHGAETGCHQARRESAQHSRPQGLYRMCCLYIECALFSKYTANQRNSFGRKEQA